MSDLPLLTVDEVAKSLVCSKKHVLNLINSGLIPVTEVSERCLRIEQDDLNLFKKQRRTTRTCQSINVGKRTGLSSKSPGRELDSLLGQPVNAKRSNSSAS